MAVSDPPATVSGGAVAIGTGPARVRLSRYASRPYATEDRLAWGALFGLVLCGAATVLCSAHTGVLSPRSVRFAPTAITLTGPLGRVGPDIHLAGAIVLFTLAILCYGVLVRLGRRLSAMGIVIAIVILHLLMALAPPLLSTDVFSYGDYGRMSAVFHRNPYLHGPIVLGNRDSWLPYIGSRWKLTPTVYGPLFTALSDLLGHLGVGTAALVYKLIAVAGSLVTIAVTARVAQRLGRDPAQAALFVGLNPVLIIYGVGGSHNDMMMMALLMCAVAALVAHRARSVGGLLVAAIAVKLTAGILLPFALAARRERSRPHMKRMLAGGVVVFVAVFIVSAILFGSGPLHLLGTLEVVQSNGGRQSIPGFIAWGLGLGRLSHGFVIGLQLLFVGSLVGLLVAVRHQRIDWITATGWAIVALLVTSTFLLPWYAVWLLPFAALSSSRWLRLVAFAFTAVGMTSL
jgi:hypothetical protein